jgi:hypothetical protein
MFVILTSRPGQYRTEPGDGLRPRETYEYGFGGQTKASFVIAELPEAKHPGAGLPGTTPSGDIKIRVIDETPPERINEIPSKFLEHFASVEAARVRLRSLTRFGGLDTTLRRVA